LLEVGLLDLSDTIKPVDICLFIHNGNIIFDARLNLGIADLDKEPMTLFKMQQKHKVFLAVVINFCF
jgi:hypothetical protein